MNFIASSFAGVPGADMGPWNSSVTGLKLSLSNRSPISSFAIAGEGQRPEHKDEVRLRN